MIFGAFGSDCIRADSVALTVATVSASTRIRPPNLFHRKTLGDSARRIFLLAGHRSCTYTVASERTEYHAKISRIERVMVRKRFAGGIIVSKSGQKVAESLCLQKLFPTITHSIIICFA